MTSSRVWVIGVCAVFLLVPCAAAGAQTSSGPPVPVAKSCMNCHANYKEMKDILAGNFKSRSVKAKSIQMQIDDRMELVKYTPETTLKNVDDIKELQDNIAIRVHYNKVGEDLVATEIVAKPKIEVPEEQLMATEDLAKLVGEGPEKGAYTLVDSRPGIKFEAGHIPTAISIPFPKMSKMTDRLPQDKNRLLIFYCEGFR